MVLIYRTGSALNGKGIEMKVSVGVDLHKNQFTVYWQYEGVESERFNEYSTQEWGYKEFIGELRKEKEKGFTVQVAVESTGNARYFKNIVEREGIGVKVINTLKFKVINESVKKTDKHDAKTIAEFLEKGMLPESRVCSEKNETIRRIIKSRKVLVRAIVSIKNQVHGLLLGYGIESRRGELQSKKGRRHILAVLKEHGHAGATVEPLLETIDRLKGEVKRFEKVLVDLVREDRVTEIIMSIPGAGIITASTISAYIDDINRFRSYKQFSSYAGLVPWVQRSNKMEHYGKITKRGPEALRTAIVQIVLGMVRSRRTDKYRLMRRYKAMKVHKGSGKTIIATARKLSKIIWYMVKNDTLFDPFKMTDPKIERIIYEMRKETIELADIPA